MSSHLPEDSALPAAIVQAWRDDQASEGDVRRAYLRFLRRRPARGRVPVFQIAGWMLAGMLLGMSGVYAATARPFKGLWFSSTLLADRPEPPPERAFRRAAPSLAPQPSGEPAAAPSARPGSAERAAAAPSRGLPTPAPTENWQRAARGLRERDFDTVSDALAELEASGGPAERDAAQLVRAQLLLSQGRDDEARSLLGNLQNGAHSANVRQKARELFARINQAGVSQRSFEEPEATKAP